jgi:tetratricopeptide (TPR) repeat protein
MAPHKQVSRTTLYIGCAAAFAFGLYCGSLLMQLREGSGQGPASGGFADPAGEYMAEERRLLELTAREPDNAGHWAGLGNLYYDLHRPDQAIDAYTRSLAREPGQKGVLVDLGVMFLARGDPGEAIRQFDKALALDPRFQPALLNKGVAFVSWGRKEAAREVWLELLRLNPGAALPDGTPLGTAVRSL